ncbi:MAG: PDC sensor domain-containing protein [Gallionellaceae bacterium]|nr:PDC sensor domain-containing protein [Gallionellaceae bacterium]
MNSNLQQAIQRQRDILKGWLASSLSSLADACREDWPARDKLETRLREGMIELPYCKYLYVLDHQARQITANIARGGLLDEHFGRDRGDRPYLAEALTGSRFSLSESYISRNAKRPSLTAVQRITQEDGTLLGYLGADFDLRELPGTQALYAQPGTWMQMRGDPAIRAGLFHQERANSPMDEHIDEVLALLVELMTVHGVYHGKLHFSSSRATLWMLDDPYSYRIHGFNDLSDPNLCLAYPRHPYPEKAIVPPEAIPKIFRCFRDLRFMDETLYLRSGSLNLFNGLVGLNFSCDGSHYMPWDEFLDKNLGFWLGTETPACV